MYSEQQRRNASARADGEFLRRMMGGELSGNGFPVMNMQKPSEPSLPQRDQRVRVRCDGKSADTNDACPNTTAAPSLAMVYAPRQCWRRVLSPAEGLAKGSIFTELLLPLEAVSQKGAKEVNIRRPF